MTHRISLRTLLAVLAIAGAGCSNSLSGTTGTGGSSASGGSVGSGGTVGSGGSSSGGSTGTGGSSSCKNVSACGGNVVGTWTATSSCLDLSSSSLDVTLAGLDPNSCKNVAMTASLTVSGTWTANADGTYTDATMTTGNAQLQMPAGCLMLSGTTTTCDHLDSPLTGLGFSTVDCQNATSGGGCTCTATVQQAGLPGVLSSAASGSGNYATSGSTLTIDGSTPYAYCVSGSQMTWTPQTTSPTTTGTVVFQKGSGTGSGGSTGTGGTVATGGSTGSGGSGSGGSIGSKGGATGSGGTSSGGTTGSGGASSGGATGTGGAKGGATGTGGTGTGGAAGSGGTTSTGGSSGTRSDGPCDIYSAAGQPCAAAYSTIRALSKTYSGSLYQVRSGSSSMNTGSGGTTKDIGMTADGFADTSSQDTFCSGSTCTISILYDQSGNGNNLKVAPAGTTSGGSYSAMPDFESSANHVSLTIAGHKVYPLYMNAREGYRLTAVGKGMPTGAKAQGIYELADGTHSGTACCWDFGDVSTNPTQYTTMNTIFFGTGFWGSGAGSGPWFMGDFEGGVWSDGASTPDKNNNDPSMKYPFAFGIVKTAPPSAMSIRAGNGNLPTATGLTTAFAGNNAAKTWNNSGGILLGIGSDNSNNSFGTFYEGAITNGEPSDTTDASVFTNVQSAGYGK
ncbi:MAG TPA: arabinofuranosidase catalytic domain-containing protein [Polyangia bacterium]|nr:arabinofuranosidase catalytic domain-containing protein [Polyangia bacterium]